MQKGIADPKRVYAAGRSLGGVMVLRLACVDAGRMAAIGLHIAAMPEATGSDCHPPKPLPVLMINGTDDRILPYKAERSVRGDVLWSTQRLVAFFSDLNGCAKPDQEMVLHNIVVERSTRCAGGPVVFYRVVGGGPDLPPVLNTSQTLLDFFRDKAR